MRYIAIGILFIALTGCAKTYWVKPGATVSDFDIDREECVKNESNASMAVGYGTYPPSQPNANAMVSGYGAYPPSQPNASAMVSGYGTYPPSQPNASAIIMVDQCLSQRGWRKATPSETTEIESRQQKQQQ
jgi:hypothetical protein